MWMAVSTQSGGKFQFHSFQSGGVSFRYQVEFVAPTSSASADWSRICPPFGGSIFVRLLPLAELVF